MWDREELQGLWVRDALMGWGVWVGGCGIGDVRAPWDADLGCECRGG